MSYWQVRVKRDRFETLFPFVSYSLACETNRGVGRSATAGLFPLVAIVLTIFVWDVHAQSAGVQQDRAALVALYEATDGPNWVHSTNWLSDAPLGDWYGVNTDSSGRVVSLFLKGTPISFRRLQGQTSHRLSGQLPSELGNLEYLRTLNLGINDLSGSIPKELGKLTRLTELNLENNDLSGEIPAELGNLSSLTTLSVADNLLTGGVPPEFSKLVNLKSLDISNNQLNGHIPREIGDLANLSSLDLSGNGIAGPIPTEFGDLTNLTILLLNGNYLVGELPHELSRLTKLREIELDGNNLSGPLPVWLGALEDLTTLSAYDNNLGGSIPATVGKLKNLTELNLALNLLSGELPNEISELSKLEYLNLSRNQLRGRINPEITKLSNLEYLNLSNNDFVGPVISGLRRLPSLETLYLNNNKLSGPLPTRFVDARNIEFFNISGNQVCVPGTHSFIYWLDNVLIHDVYSLSFCNATDRSILERLFEDTSGESWVNANGWGDDEIALERWHGIKTDALGRVISIDLGSNGLAGTLPLDLGYLSQLADINLEDNQLEGRLPLSLRRSKMQDFQFANTALCVPMEMEFQAWLDESVAYEGTGLSCDPITEREVMGMFFTETEGDAWSEASNWLSSAPLGDWHGVEVDNEGRVTSIHIAANNLSGSVPLELASLSQLQTLNLTSNALSGTIPPELGALVHLSSIDLSFNNLLGEIPPELGKLNDLSELDLSYNNLTGTIPAELGNLRHLKSLTLSGNQLVGSIPSEIGNLTSLHQLHLSFNQLHGSIPTELGNLQKLLDLQLQNNGLSGAIPAELGNLTNLESLWLYFNDFTGEIPVQISNLIDLQVLNLQFNRLGGELPRELGNLVHLERLYLSFNRFEGQIPGELGNLTRLKTLSLERNRLIGEIPAELGNLSELTQLQLQDNELSGSIPIELGRLSNLSVLELNENELDGSLPQSLGQLTELEGLYLHNNALTGSIPLEFGGLTQLRFLTLSENLGMSGPVPGELTALKHIEVLLTVGTTICLPLDPAFSEWLIRVYKRRIRSCASDGPLLAFLTQSVQSHDYPVPLVAGERALLRVFPLGSDKADLTIPEVRVRFLVNDEEIFLANMPSRVLATPTYSEPGNLASSSNIEIPGSVVRPGLELVIEVFSDVESDSATASSAQGSTNSRLPIEVHELPDFDLTLIPFVWEHSDDDSIVDVVNAMAANPQDHEMFEETRTLLPIARLNVTAHEPVTSSSNDGFVLLRQTRLIKAIEGGTGYYMGMMSSVRGGLLGVAGLSGRESFSVPRSDTIAHEFGHNFSLLHAPCGGPGRLDRSFPYADGTLGSWGYTFRDGGALVRPSTPDLMSYCRPKWISDYHFTNALRYRLFDEFESTRSVSAARPSLLIWGGQSANNELVLNPSFVVYAPPELPKSPGEFEINAQKTNGDKLFSLSFDMQEISDSEGQSSFVFVVPIRPNWNHELNTLVLKGPRGVTAVDSGNAASMSLLRNPTTRQIRGILSIPYDESVTRTKTIKEGASDRGFEVLFSRGSRASATWNP